MPLVLLVLGSVAAGCAGSAREQRGAERDAAFAGESDAGTEGGSELPAEEQADAAADGESEVPAKEEADAQAADAGTTNECEGDRWDDDGDPETPCVARSVCEAGEYVSSPGDVGSDRHCRPCPSGEFSATENASECRAWSDCEPGTYVKATPTATRDRTCAECVGGTQTTRPNQSTCLLPDVCPAGTVQTAPATAEEVAQCERCSAGQYCAGGEAAGEACGVDDWDHDSEPATACVARTPCVAGEYVLASGSPTMDRLCGECSHGSFSTTVNASSCTPWTVCGNGYEEDLAGSATRDRTCVAMSTGDPTDGGVADGSTEGCAFLAAEVAAQTGGLAEPCCAEDGQCGLSILGGGCDSSLVTESFGRPVPCPP